jgi:hypothetical protein
MLLLSFLHFRFVLVSLFQAGFGFGSAAGFSNSFFPKGPAKNDPFAAFGAVSSFGFGFVSLFFYFFISLFLFYFYFFSDEVSLKILSVYFSFIFRTFLNSNTDGIRYLFCSL